MQKEHIVSEMKIIQLQLLLAKKSAKKIYTPQSTLLEVELHINHSLKSINHLITYVNDLKTTTA
jgi:hypothetical protein